MFEAFENHEDHEEEMDTSEPDASINQVRADMDRQQDSNLASIIIISNNRFLGNQHGKQVRVTI